MTNSKSRQRKKTKKQTAASKKVPVGFKRIMDRIEKTAKNKTEFNFSPEVKISDVVSQMLKPLLSTSTSFEHEKQIYGVGIMAWNLGVLKTYRGLDKMEEALRSLVLKFPLELVPVIRQYIEVKCTEYNEFDQLIHDYEFVRIDEKHTHFSVAYKSINK